MHIEQGLQIDFLIVIGQPAAARLIALHQVPTHLAIRQQYLHEDIQHMVDASVHSVIRLPDSDQTVGSVCSVRCSFPQCFAVLLEQILDIYMLIDNGAAAQV